MLFHYAHIRDDQEIDFCVRGKCFRFLTTWGLFSPKHVDEGTALLLENIEVGEKDTILDIGCGYGPIGVVLGREAKEGEVHMVDKDFVAIEYAKKNAQINTVTNSQVYLSNGLSHVSKEISFDCIVSNVPAKIGKELLYILTLDTKSYLKQGGRFYIVVVKGLKESMKRNFKEIFGNYKKVKQGKNYVVMMAKKE